MTLALEGTRFEERDISLPADLSRLLEARRFIARAAADFGFDAAAAEQIKLAANEAVANAMEHGSPAPAREIAVRAVEEEAGSLVI